MVRWNRTWNTIELRCLESDRVDYDISKFVWAAGAMKRLDPKGEALEPVVLTTEAPLDAKMLEDAWKVSGNSVSILSTVAIHELTARAIHGGLRDPLVEAYLHRLAAFAEPGVDPGCLPVFQIAKRALSAGTTTAEVVLAATGRSRHVTQDACVPVIREVLEQERSALRELRSEFPGVIAQHRSELFPILPRGRFDSQA
jgi:hypothetical protein